MDQDHWGSSRVQQLASPEIARAWLVDPEGGRCVPESVEVEPRVALGDQGATCRPDGRGTTADGDRVVVEVAMGVAAKGGQVRKASDDIFKLAALRAAGAAERCVSLATSPDLFAKVTGPKSWRWAAASLLGVEVALVNPGSQLAKRLVTTAGRQGERFRELK